LVQIAEIYINYKMQFTMLVPS